MIDFVASNAGVIGLLMFFSIFMIAVVWTYAPMNKKKYENYGNIPLKENNHDA